MYIDEMDFLTFYSTNELSMGDNDDQEESKDVRSSPELHAWLVDNCEETYAGRNRWYFIIHTEALVAIFLLKFT